MSGQCIHDLADDALRNVGLSIHVHDEPCRDLWACGRCPYLNWGPICTKCGAPAYEGSFIGGTVVRP